MGAGAVDLLQGFETKSSPFLENILAFVGLYFYTTVPLSNPDAWVHRWNHSQENAVRHVYCCVALVVGCLIGCGPGDGRVAVNGSVTLKGEPLDEGVIEFISTGMKSGTTIQNGKYDIPRDQGLIAGTYKVMITSGDGRTPADSPDGLPGPTGANIVSKDRIPKEYNINTKLEAKVEGSSPNKFDFAIP